MLNLKFMCPRKVSCLLSVEYGRKNCLLSFNYKEDICSVTVIFMEINSFGNVLNENQGFYEDIVHPLPH